MMTVCFKPCVAKDSNCENCTHEYWNIDELSGKARYYTIGVKYSESSVSEDTEILLELIRRITDELIQIIPSTETIHDKIKIAKLITELYEIALLYNSNKDMALFFFVNLLDRNRDFLPGWSWQRK